MITDVGISGTRHGATSVQLAKITLLLGILKEQGAMNFRHGDCVGVDVEVADIAREFGYRIFVHPGPNGVGSKADYEYCSMPFLDRNKMIVDMSDVMLIVPYTNKEILRSGTWATYRYAKKMCVPIKMVKR